MKRYIKNKPTIIFFSFLLYISLIVGFFLNENLTTGAYWDYKETENIAQNFLLNFKDTLLNFDRFHTRHSPLFVIFISGLIEIFQSDFLVRMIHLHILLYLPLVFFLCLQEKYSNTNNNILFLFSLIIILSPVFRSLSIWPDSRNLGLAIFLTSLLFFLKFEKKKNFSNAFYCIIFYALSSYISPNFSVLALFFLYKFYINYRLSNIFLFILFINLILVAPALYYIFYLDVNFLFKSAIYGGEINLKIWFNYFNKLFCISTIALFYFLPFLFSKLSKIDLQKSFNNISLNFSLIILFLIGLYYFNYNVNFGGGGIFFQISNKIFQNLIFFYFVVLISFYILNQIFSLKNENYFLFLLIILSNVQETIYHKYYDPMMIILYLTLFTININSKKFNEKTLSIFAFFYITLMFLYYIKDTI